GLERREHLRVSRLDDRGRNRRHAGFLYPRVTAVDTRTKWGRAESLSRLRSPLGLDAIAHLHVLQGLFRRLELADRPVSVTHRHTVAGRIDLRHLAPDPVGRVTL